MRKHILFSLALLSMAGCSGKLMESDQTGAGTPSLTLRAAEMQGDAAADCRIDDVAVYRFENGILAETVFPQRSGTGNVFRFEAESDAGRMYLLANYSGLEAVRDLVPGVSTEDEFISMEASAGEMLHSGFLMTGTLGRDDFSGLHAEAVMTRSLARLDILSQDSGVQVLGAVVRGLAEKGPVNPDMAWRKSPEGMLSAAGAASNDAGISSASDFSEDPLSNGRRTLTYLVPQRNASVSAEITAEFGGALHRFETSLPSVIRSNTVYTLSVRGNGAGVSVSVSEGSWSGGGVSGSVPSLKGLVDVENSVLPEGVRVNDLRDTVFVPYSGSSFVLSVLAEPSAEVVAEGVAEGVLVNVGQPRSRSLVNAASVEVTSSLRMPGSGEEVIWLDVRNGDFHYGKVVLVFEASPVEIDGILSFDADAVCDFGKYADGELAVVALPADMTLSIGFPEGEDAWMKLEDVTEHTAGNVSGKRRYRLLGGWKPNDPKADGRIQEGFLKIGHGDGRSAETYTVRRRNWGLPVVRMGDTWWCRYNLRGNVKDFRDQITCENDPASPDELFTLLQTMPEDRLLDLMGDQYQAGNPDGLPLRHDGSAFYHEGMASSAQNFGLADPAEMAPDGYVIPGYDDYAFFSGSDNFNLGGIGERNFSNMDGQRLTVRIAERDVDFLGHRYGTVAFYDFAYGDSHWTLFGLGHQWNTLPGNIAVMNLLMATWGDGSRTWSMEGYSSTDRPGQNWMKFVANNSVKTRMIRCVKTPVEYIYE